MVDCFFVLRNSVANKAKINSFCKKIMTGIFWRYSVGKIIYAFMKIIQCINLRSPSWINLLKYKQWFKNSFAQHQQNVSFTIFRWETFPDWNFMTVLHKYLINNSNLFKIFIIICCFDAESRFREFIRSRGVFSQKELSVREWNLFEFFPKYSF